MSNKKEEVKTIPPPLLARVAATIYGFKPGPSSRFVEGSLPNEQLATAVLGTITKALAENLTLAEELGFELVEVEPIGPQGDQHGVVATYRLRVEY